MKMDETRQTGVHLESVLRTVDGYIGIPAVMV